MTESGPAGVGHDIAQGPAKAGPYTGPEAGHYIAIRRIAHMGAAFAVSNVARGVIALATSLVVGRGLGQQGFGRWLFCTAWASTLTTLFDLGFGVLLTREAARDRSVGALLASAMTIRLAAFLPVGVAFYAVAPWLGDRMDVSAGLRVAVVLAASGVMYGCLAAVFRAWPDRLVWILGVESAGAIVQCGGSWWLLRRGGGIEDLLWLATVVQTGQLLIALVRLRSIAPAGDRLSMPSFGETLATVRRALPFAFAGLIGVAHRRMPPLLLGYMQGPDEVAAFGVAWRMGDAARAVPSAAFAGALPVLTERERHGDADRVRPLFDRALHGFGIAAALFLALLARPLVRLTYGPAFASAASPLLWVAVGLVPSLSNAARRIYLYSAGREVVAVRWSAVALVVQLLLAVVLIPVWGAVGAACALLVGEVAVWWPLRTA